MELHQAQAFVAVAREHSFTRGSVRLHRSQPAVSQAIAALEREVGEALFERQPRAARPTPAGEALLLRLAPLLAQWESVAERLVEDLTAEPSGVLRVGAGETALLHLLPEAVRRFRVRHAAVRLDFRHQRRDESLLALEAGTIDLAIRAATELPAGTIVEPLTEIARVVVAAASHPLAAAKRVSWRRLAGEPWVLPPPGTDTRRELADRFAAQGLTFDVAVETGGWEIVKRYVALGLGLSAIPAVALTQEDRRRLAVLAVTPALPRERFQLWLGRASANRPAARAFASILRETLAARA